jgi:hypothetical protein
VQVGSETSWSSVGAGTRRAAPRIDGTLWCWGLSLGGELPASSLTPVSVALGGAVEAVGADLHGCVRDDTGTAHCWGDNFDGELGDGSAWATSFRLVVH